MKAKLESFKGKIKKHTENKIDKKSDNCSSNSNHSYLRIVNYIN